VRRQAARAANIAPFSAMRSASDIAGSILAPLNAMPDCSVMTARSYQSCTLAGIFVQRSFEARDQTPSARNCQELFEIPGKLLPQLAVHYI
jgi:hypothetical protein